MVHYTLITNAEHEQKVLNFLLSLGLYEITQNLYLQLNFVINSTNGQNDYCLCYNDESYKMFKEDLWELGECKEIEEFLDIIKNSLPPSPKGISVEPLIMGYDPAITGYSGHGKTFNYPLIFGKGGEINKDEPDWVGDAKRFAKYWDDIHIMSEKHYTKLEIQHYNPMRQITLENLESIKPEEVVVVFQDKRNLMSLKRSLFLLCTYVPRGIEQYEGYGFMTTSDPLSTTRVFTSDSKLKSIELALQAGHEIYVCEEITRIQFSNSEPKSFTQFLNQKVEQKEKESKTIQGIEQYIFGLLRKHTEYLISELGLSQYPRKNYFDVTERFINDKIK